MEKNLDQRPSEQRPPFNQPPLMQAPKSYYQYKGKNTVAPAPKQIGGEQKIV